MKSYVIYPSPIGNLTVVSEENAIIGLWIEGQKHFLSSIKEPMVEKKTPILEEAMEWLTAYFLGKNAKISFLLQPQGTVFQRMVWEELEKIPYGEVCTYKDITRKIEKRLQKRMSPQAVAGAISRNPISILIPCHRVIGSDGKLTGYAGGIEKKSFLLDLERRKKNVTKGRNKRTALPE